MKMDCYLSESVRELQKCHPERVALLGKGTSAICNLNAFEMEIRPTLFTLLEFHASWSFIPRMWESSDGGV